MPKDKDTVKERIPAIRKTAVKSALEEKWAKNIRNMLLVEQLRPIFDIECEPDYWQLSLEEKVKLANDLAKVKVMEANERNGDNEVAYEITVEDYRAVCNKIDHNHKLLTARNIIFSRLYAGVKFREAYSLMWMKAENIKNPKAMADFLAFPLEYGYRVQKLMNLAEQQKKAEERKKERQVVDLGGWENKGGNERKDGE